MRFHPTDVAGAFLVEATPSADVRGSFSRVHCRREFAAAGIAFDPVQTSVSRNLASGTVRGLHYQVAPSLEAKLVRCVTGAAFDAIVDLRRGSPSFGRAAWAMLESDGLLMMYVPRGCAHGFQTVRDDTTMLYLISAEYDAASARGLRWDDPALGIPWPLKDSAILSSRDRELPALAATAPLDVDDE